MSDCFQYLDTLHRESFITPPTDSINGEAQKHSILLCECECVFNHLSHDD